MTDNMNIQWYPGHMTKTRRQMEADLKQVDAVCEIVDARIPMSSRNPDIDSICGNKPRIIVLNRMDLADPSATKKWREYFRGRGMAVLATDCKSRQGISDFTPAARIACAEKLERDAARGMNRPLRVMVVGIPNVGKSTFINCLAGRVKAKAEDRPGVTVTKQWVTTSAGMDLLDMPGVLWPKFEDRLVGENLAATGAIKDQILDTEAIAVALCGRLFAVAPDKLCARYKLEREALECLESWQIFELIGKRRGFLMSGGIVNTERTALMLLDEFRSAKIGQISLETPEILETNSI